MPPPHGVADFAAKLRIALGHANLGRAALAQEARVDKSVVARWLNGRSQPVDHHLIAISAALGRRLPGFTVLDWEAPLAGFLARPEAPPPAAPPAAAPLLANAEPAARAAELYAGLWLVLHASTQRLDRVMAVTLALRAAPQGLQAEVRGNEVSRWLGPAYASHGKLWLTLAEVSRGDSFGCWSLWGSSNGAAQVMDGVMLIRDGGLAAAPAAVRCIAFRLGDAAAAAGDSGLEAITTHARGFSRSGWEAVLPAFLPPAFRRDPGKPTQQLVRVPLESSWTLGAEHLLGGSPTLASHRALLALRELFALAPA
jgi:transcriptional regulator with XRE-family HTH domain